MCGIFNFENANEIVNIGCSQKSLAKIHTACVEQPNIKIYFQKLKIAEKLINFQPLLQKIVLKYFGGFV